MRKGRGRLSSVDQLPEEATPYVRRALKQLSERELTQEAIRNELNQELRILGIEPISRSAFNRKSLTFAATARHLEQSREIAAVMAERMDEQPEGDVGLLLAEVIKTLVHDVLSGTIIDGEVPSLEMLRKAAIILRNLETGRKANFQASTIRQNFMDKVIDALDQAVEVAEEDGEPGLSKERIAQIRREVLGVRDT